ncbi:hypothetical protein ASZ90_019154 [hydrocarbon metagenome]|uniref:Uncharacterized protein n=1 Tax=hydrocarbon metagenome TaxID=938273 RepID=A0A0W8E477_9ZZZZ
MIGIFVERRDRSQVFSKMMTRASLYTSFYGFDNLNIYINSASRIEYLLFGDSYSTSLEVHILDKLG